MSGKVSGTRQGSSMSPPGAAGPSERFRSLYEANYHLILGYALRRADATDAADVVAETFTTAWRRLRDVPEGEEARLWLYGVARRVLANQRRAERRRLRLAGRLRAESRIAPSAGAEPSVERDILAAFSRLRRDDRELLSLTAWEGLDPGEIARVLGCSRNAARIRLHRARRRFADELERPLVKRGRRGGHLAEDLL
jgi:RNA polymerase sigma factor (sigma-70 family)